MSIQLEPLELGFRRPFTQEVTEVLRLRNPTSEPVAFKVKTTAPKQYCVRPNSGRIDPGQDVEVQVLLQAMKEDPPLEVKCRDKFLVQTVGVPANQDFKNWSDIESTSKSSIQEKKIRVLYLPGPGQASPAAGLATTPRKSTGVDEAPPAYSSPVSNAVTPSHTSVRDAVTTGPVSKMESKPDGARSLGDAVNSAGNPETSVGSSAKSAAAGIAGATAGAAAGAAATVKNAVPTNRDELDGKLAAVNAQATQLKEQAQDQTGLRQRRTDSTTGERSAAPGGSLATQQQAPSGVPVPIVAALCLMSFLLAYLLF